MLVSERACVWDREGVMLGVGVSSLLFEQTELTSGFPQMPNSTSQTYEAFPLRVLL